jgi:glycerol-3-phosphate dehydrogenase (NAD(P)+)
MKSDQILVVGEGAWGCALAHRVCQKRHSVALWCQQPLIAEEIATKKTNTHYLPGIALDTRIAPVVDLAQAIERSSTLIITTPVLYLRKTLSHERDLLRNKMIIVGCKGIEKDTGLTPAEIIRELQGDDHAVITLAGGSFARELIAESPTNLVFASKHRSARSYAAELFRSSTTVCDETDDEMGVALCAALKNVYAIGGGILTALATGENTHAFYCVRVVRELKLLLASAGGSLETLLGSAGIGDLILTSLALESKNRTYGYLRGSGKPHSAWENSGRPYPEGVNTLNALRAVQERYQITLPLAQALYAITYGDAPAETLIRELLSDTE